MIGGISACCSAFGSPLFGTLARVPLCSVRRRVASVLSSAAATLGACVSRVGVIVPERCALGPNPAVNRTRRHAASPSVGVGGGAPVTLFR